MKEQLLHFVWQHKLFNTRDLKSADGQALHIVDFGRYNKDGGPDFWNAKIKLDDIVLVGNIEIHVSASDWKLHQHDKDNKYKNVILHVVYFNDDTITQLPTLELNSRIPPVLLNKYQNMMQSHQPLVCLPVSNMIDDFTLEKWKDRLLIERLERKSDEILNAVKQSQNDWEQVCYHLLGRYFGSHINKEPFELLTTNIDYKILQKHSNDLFQLEALLFGTAGFLNKDFVEIYPREIKQEFQFLQHKYQLKPLQEHHWQFLRIRPISFPTIRLAWFAKLMQQLPLFQTILEDVGSFHFLDSVSVSDYWTNHYTLDKLSKYKQKTIGDEFKNVLKINVFAPLLYAYGKYTNDDKWIDKSFYILHHAEAEKNHKTSIFAPAKWQQKHAHDSQAYIELYDYYCAKKRCLECSIGHRILNENNQ
jgi:hypothetical protein